MTFFKHDGTYCYVANPENKKKVIQQGDNWFDESLNKVIDKYVPWPSIPVSACLNQFVHVVMIYTSAPWVLRGYSCGYPD